MDCVLLARHDGTATIARAARKRGRSGSWQTATVGLGSATATAVVLAFTAILPAEQLNSWGWRIPFLIALQLRLIGLYMRLRLEETPTTSKSRN